MVNFSPRPGEAGFLALGTRFGHGTIWHSTATFRRVSIAPLAVLSPGPRPDGVPSRGEEVREINPATPTQRWSGQIGAVPYSQRADYRRLRARSPIN